MTKVSMEKVTLAARDVTTLVAFFLYERSVSHKQNNNVKNYDKCFIYPVPFLRAERPLSTIIPFLFPSEHVNKMERGQFIEQLTERLDEKSATFC